MFRKKRNGRRIRRLKIHRQLYVLVELSFISFLGFLDFFLESAWSAIWERLSLLKWWNHCRSSISWGHSQPTKNWLMESSTYMSCSTKLIDAGKEIKVNINVAWCVNLDIFLTCKYCGQALPLGELGGCLGRWEKGASKIQLCGSGSDESTPKKGNEHDESEWNTRSYSLWEDRGTTLFQVCWRRVDIFPNNFNFTYTRQPMSQVSINFIHVINFSNVQNVLRICVMYVMSRVRIFV